MDNKALPLAGVRVIELGHVVMGSSCGLVLADMGADVIKVEKAPGGDDTRRFGGFGSGLFHFFNRNKKSLVIDLKTAEGKEVLGRAIATADVLVENFGPGAVERLGFGYEACRELNPGLIYCSLKGFMPGPYESRPSLDNLVQMMGGLAYMTGPAGRPLRAGASVTDILGGTFGALGIIAALYERRATGKGQKVTASLFEATAYLVGQHMSAAAVLGHGLPPMPEGENPWAVYDLFETASGEQVCIGVVSDRHWTRLCEALELPELAAEPAYANNDGRKQARNFLLAELQKRIGQLPTDEVNARCERAGLPFAPVRQPVDLFEDRQLLEGGGMVDTRLADGRMVPLPKIPLRMDDHDFGLRRQTPAIGEGARDFLAVLGYPPERVAELVEQSVLVIEDGADALSAPT
jgi:crotonobetainyl-CoA:carnitine CoA-transferase CaiB-like acyl-CoA transferase